jgi:hypothetical protein
MIQIQSKSKENIKIRRTPSLRKNSLQSRIISSTKVSKNMRRSSSIKHQSEQVK